MLRNRTLVGVALALIAALAVASTGAQPLKPLDKEPEVPYVPTHERIVAEMLKVAKVGKSDVLYDLGSGDGRIVITAAKKFGTRGVGVDVDPVRVKEARENAAKAGVADRVKFLQQDLFETDIREATVVTLYLLPSLNVKLIPQLEKMKPGSRIVSHDFDMRGIKPKKIEMVETKERGTRKVYLWVTPLERE